MTLSHTKQQKAQLEALGLSTKDGHHDDAKDGHHDDADNGDVSQRSSFQYYFDNGDALDHQGTAEDVCRSDTSATVDRAGKVLIPETVAQVKESKLYEEQNVYFGWIPLAKDYANEAHEIVYVEKSNALFMSMLTQSALYKVPLNAKTSRPYHQNTHSATAFGHKQAGLHNVWKSGKHGEEMLWLSTQCENRILLVNSSDLTLEPKYTLQVPTRLTRTDDKGRQVCDMIGGPHSVREAPDGSLWVALKGKYTSEVLRMTICTGGEWTDLERGIYAGWTSNVHENENSTLMTEAFAVWHVHPDEFNLSKPDFGGRLYHAMKSPVMTDFDGEGNVFTGQDASPYIIRVGKDGKDMQIPMPISPVTGKQIPSSGPAVVAAPDGSVWVASLGCEVGTLVRFKPGQTVPEVITALAPQDATSWADRDLNLERRIIHLAFSTRGGRSGTAKMLYALTSSLLKPESAEEMLTLQFTDDWQKVNTTGEVGTDGVGHHALPGYNTGAHRIVIVEGAEVKERAAFISSTLSASLISVTASEGNF